MCWSWPLYYGILHPQHQKKGRVAKKNTSKTSQNLIANLHPRNFLNGMKFSRIFFCSLQACNCNQSIFSKPENVGKQRSWQNVLKLYIHWYLIEWSVEQMMQLPSKIASFYILLVSVSYVCDAVSAKSRKVHHLDCKNRSEERTCTSNSEVYSHKWITIFYIWISICSLRVAAQELSFYGIRRWALRVPMGNMTEPWLLLLSGNVSGLCLDEMGCRPFSVFFQKPLHIRIKFLYSSCTPHPSIVLHRDRERWNWTLTWVLWNSLIFYFFHTKDWVNSWNILKLCSNTKTIELWHIQKDPASPQIQGDVIARRNINSIRMSKMQPQIWSDLIWNLEFINHVDYHFSVFQDHCYCTTFSCCKLCKKKRLVIMLFIIIMHTLLWQRFYYIISHPLLGPRNH